MKTFNHIVLLFLAAIIITACEEGIDPITPVQPGPDADAPTVTITSPANGLLIKVKEDLATIRIQGEVRDDIELESVTITLNGNDLIVINEFRDYRRYIIDHTYTQVTNGPHTLTVTGKDKSGKTTTQSVNFEKVEPYRPVYDGEIFYMPFDQSFVDLISEVEATTTGTPAFAPGGKAGTANAGAANSYLSFPVRDETQGVNLLHTEFSAVFWYKYNDITSATRAGILSITPNPVSPATSGSRNFGFRFIREGGAINQKFNFNVGNGTGEGWADGGAAATLNPTIATDWIFMAITISQSELAVFINGDQVIRNTSFTGIDWTGCTTLSIMSGAPNFVEWNHLSDLSMMDELRIFNKALTQEEIRTIMSDTQ
jgi:hypothetical protein